MHPGDILRATWAVYRDDLRHLVTIAAVVYVPLGAIVAVLTLAGWPGLLAANVLAFACLFLVEGAVVTAVADLRERGRARGLGAALEAAGRRLAPLAAAGILATIGILAGLALFVIPGLVLLTWWLLIGPAIMVEGTGVADAFRRSRALVAGSSWPVFAIVVLTLLVLVALSLAVGLVLAPLPGAPRELLTTAIANSLGAPFAAVAWTLTYFRLREIEEERAAGYTPPP